MALSEGQALEVAQRVVIRLCGNRWTYPPARMVDVYPVPQGRVIYLSGRPVVEIHSVTIDGELVDPTDYTLLYRYAVKLADTVRVPVRCGERVPVEVDYTYGVFDLPDLMVTAIETLKTELLAADSGGTCRIPERVTSVTRQGVSWTMIDPQDFLDAGRTGIYEIDLAIKNLNPSGAKQRARLFTATTSAPPQRRAV